MHRFGLVAEDEVEAGKVARTGSLGGEALTARRRGSVTLCRGEMRMRKWRY